MCIPRRITTFLTTDKSRRENERIGFLNVYIEASRLVRILIV